MILRTFRGGRKSKRDRFYGLEDKPNFDVFREWWHRCGKSGGPDLAERKEAKDAWDQWIAEGCPTVKIGKYLFAHKETELQEAAQARDFDRMINLLAQIKLEDKSDELERATIDLLWRMDDRRVRNALAIVLADIKSLDGAEAIRKILREPYTLGARGTLLYALSEMGESLDLETAVDIIIDDSFEAAEESLAAIEDHRVTRADEKTITRVTGKIHEALSKARNDDHRTVLEEAANLISQLSS